MPQRTRPVRKDSSYSLGSLSPSDVPWFCNFGKFVDNPDFLLSKRSNPAKTIEPSTSRKWSSANTPAGGELRVPHDNEANLNSITPFTENATRSYRPLRAHGGARIVSEVPLPISKHVEFSRDQNMRKGGNPEKFDVSDELTPVSLGAILRRMVSFDNYGKSRNVSRLRNDMEFSRPVNQPTTQERNSTASPVDPIPSFTYVQCPSSLSADRPKGIAASIHKSPAKDLRVKKNIADTSRNRVRISRMRRETSKADEESSRNLGAVVRRMISFEKRDKDHMRT